MRHTVPCGTQLWYLRSYTRCTVRVKTPGTGEAAGEPLGVFPCSGLEQPWTVAGGQANVLITTTCVRPGARAVNVKSPRGCSAGAENSPRGKAARTQCRSDDEPRFRLRRSPTFTVTSRPESGR